MDHNIQVQSNRSVKNGYIILLLVLTLGSGMFVLNSMTNIKLDSSSFNIYGNLDDQSGSINHVNAEVIQHSDYSSAKIHTEVKEQIDDKADNDDGTSDAIHEKQENELHVVPNEALVGDKSETDTENIQTNSDKLNILLLYPDDWRWNSIGRENPLIQTPFLDSLGDEGMRFRKNCVTSSVCWLSRATLFSGQYSSRHQSWKLRCPHFAKWNRWEASYPKLLQKNGYYVGHVGKWQYYSDNKKRFDWSRWHEGKHWYQMGSEKISADERACNDAIAFLRERPKDKPFALSVAFYPPKPVGTGTGLGDHYEPKKNTLLLYQNLTIQSPYGANATLSFQKLPEFLRESQTIAIQSWYQRYRDEEHYQQSMKNMYALITQVDDACRRIVDELKQQGQYNNTMIIFTTDNGMFHGSHGLAGKWYPYQESIRVPLIIYDPRMPSHKRGLIDDNYTLNIDLAPTILGAAGLPPHESMQGRDISDLYLEKEMDRESKLERQPWRQEFFYEFRFHDSKQIPGSDALVNHKYKYIEWVENGNYAQLFDLEKDPFEVQNLLLDDDNIEGLQVAKAMKSRLHQRAHTLRDNEPILKCEAGEYSSVSPDRNPSL